MHQRKNATYTRLVTRIANKINALNMTTRKMRITIFLVVPIVILLDKSLLNAEEYIRTGPVTAHESHGFVIKYHDQHTVAAIEKNGQLYEFKKVWDKVDKYNETKGVCTLYTKYKAGGASGPISSVINTAYELILLERTEKGFRRINANYVTFPCTRR